MLDGEILEYSLIDNRCEPSHEITSDQSFPIPLSNISNNWFPIDYIRLPEFISNDETITENKTCHCQTIISNNAHVIIADRSSGNEFGIIGFGGSSMNVLGDEGAASITETQQFVDNKIHGLFSYSSYPAEIHFNAFSKSAPLLDFPYIEVVYYDIIEDPPPDPPDYSVIFDITCNYWDQNFEPDDHLIPEGSFIYLPYWTPGSTCDPEMNAGILYQEASNEIQNGNYNQADSSFKQIIADYPSDNYAISALRDLYTLEGVNGNDYNALKLYYESVISEDADSLLCSTANWLTMHCDVILENTQEAINWLDSVISVPDGNIDSIFAIINLGYIYTHMPDSNLKALYITQNPEHIPTSFNHYRIRREELIKELLKPKKGSISESQITAKSTYSGKYAIIEEIYPNPIKNSFEIECSFFKNGRAVLEVYSVHGQIMEKFNLGEVSMGNTNNQITLKSIPVGMYYIILKLDDHISDSKKIIKI